MTQSDLRALADELMRLWTASSLTADLTIEFSSRLSHALGRCLPERRIIRLSTELQTAPEELVRNVLCHELAHLIAYERFGPDVRPHGPEWQDLMKVAGYRPERRMPWILHGNVTQGRRSRSLFEHRCPVCQMVRVARTSTPRWRCSECVADGLGGELTVTRIGNGKSSG